MLFHKISILHLAGSRAKRHGRGTLFSFVARFGQNEVRIDLVWS